MSLYQAQEVYTPRYLTLIEIYNSHERDHWIPDEADMRADVEQWKNGKIPAEEKAFIKMVLRLFTQNDKNISDAYVDRLLPLFKDFDARQMLKSFASREDCHVNAYKKLNDTLGYDSEEFMKEFLSFSQMKEKHDFMMESGDLTTPSGIASYLARQILMEGVNLFASFAMLLSFSQQGKLPGMVSVNQWSIADETSHVRGLCELFRLHLEENPSVINNAFKHGVYEVAREVIRLEDEFIDLCFSVGKTSVVDADSLKAYIRYVCDYRMQQMGFKPQFGITSNPIGWIDDITGNTFGNFFETTSVQYSKASMTGEWVY